MKKLLVILFTISTISLFAQTNDTIEKAKVDYTPGYHLQKASKQYFYSLICVGAGITFLAGHTINVKNTDDNSTPPPHFLVMGIGAGVAAIAFQVAAWVNIGKAGKEMDKRGIAFQTNQHGIGIAYRF